MTVATQWHKCNCGTMHTLVGWEKCHHLRDHHHWHASWYVGNGRLSHLEPIWTLMNDWTIFFLGSILYQAIVQMVTWQINVVLQRRNMHKNLNHYVSGRNRVTGSAWRHKKDNFLSVQLCIYIAFACHSWSYDFFFINVTYLFIR